MTKNPTWTMTGSQVHRLLNPVLPHLDRRGPAVLNAVRITSTPGYIVAAATDRYRIAAQRIAVADAPADLYIVLPASAAKTLLRIAKPTRALDPELNLTVEGGGLTVETAGLFGAEGVAGRVSLALEQAAYPHIASLLEPSREDDVRVPLNPSLLAAFAAAQTAGEPMVLSISVRPDQPAAISIGDDFMGAMQPMRGGEVPERWSTGEPAKPSAKPKAKGVAA